MLSSVLPRGVDALAGPGEGAPDLLRLFERGQRLLGSVAHAGGVEREVAFRRNQAATARVAVGQLEGAPASSVSLSSVHDHLVALVLVQLLPAGGHLLVGGDEQDRKPGFPLGEGRVERLPRAVLGEALVLGVDRNAAARAAPAPASISITMSPFLPPLAERSSPTRWATSPRAAAISSSSSNACCSNVRPLPVPRFRSAASSSLRLARAA